MNTVAQYFANIQRGKIVLWCYLIWYLVTVAHHFDPAPKLWINAVGISAIIGTGLLLSISSAANRVDRWQTIRLFMMPFGVSSFSALIKDQGFLFVFSPNPRELGIATVSCLLFVACVTAIKSIQNRRNADF